MKVLIRVLIAIAVIGGLGNIPSSLAQPNAAKSVDHAESQNGDSAIGLGVSVPTPMGDDYQIFGRLAGVFAEAWMASPEFIGRDFQSHFRLGYQPYSLKNITDVGLRQVYAFYGLETRFDVSRVVIPFISFDVGAYYSWLNFSSGSNNALVSGWSAAAQIRPGFNFPLIDKLSITAAIPITFVFTNNFTVWSSEGSLRWAL